MILVLQLGCQIVSRSHRNTFHHTKKQEDIIKRKKVRTLNVSNSSIMFSLNLQFMSNHPIRDALIHRIKELSDHRGPDDPTLGQYIHFTDSLTYKTEDECYVISLDRDHELKWRALHLEYYSPFQEAGESSDTIYIIIIH